MVEFWLTEVHEENKNEKNHIIITVKLNILDYS